MHSSVTPATVRELDATVRAAGARLVDAPVSGSRPAADASVLTVLTGAAAEDLAEVDPVLRAFAGQVLHVGEVGSGQAVKITNNVLLHLNHLVTLEGLPFARAQGLTEQAVIEAANLSTGRSWVTETCGLIDDMIFDHPAAGTPVLHSMMSKEIWQAVTLARTTLTALPLTALGTQVSQQYFVERETELRAHRQPTAR